MKSVVAYVLVLTICGFAIWLTLVSGRNLETRQITQHIPSKGANQGSIADTFSENFRGPLGTLLTQIVLIVLVSRMVGNVAQKIGQPQVVGEMVAGILLGPSFLGQISPSAMRLLFPPASMDTLRMFSQVGVILFMFLVGTDVDSQHLSRKAHTAVLVSHASIIIPFFLGTSLSLLIYPSMASQAVPFTAFGLFIGVAMSITAFPVLACIVEERGLTNSALGVISLGCAAVDDVTAWCILAAVLAIVKANGFGSSILTMLLVLVYASAMIFLLKPFLRRLVPIDQTTRQPYNAWAALILAFALASSLVTEIIGVHALFGAFLAGVTIPPGSLRSFCRERFESIASGLLLPLFFVFTGLRTEINLLNSAAAWAIAGAVILAAVTGKLGGSMLVARWSGMKWRDSFALGALMNTRGLMELIVLNIGYDLGILSSQIFAILVLMAITTTLMTVLLLVLAF